MRDVKIVLRLKSERFISIFFNSAPLQLLLAIALLLLLDLPDSNLSDPCHAIKVRSGLGAIISFSDSKGQSRSSVYLYGRAALESNPGSATMPLLGQSPNQG